MDGVIETTPKAAAKRAQRQRALYGPLDWLMVRAPLLPVEAYLQFCAPEAPSAALLADPRVRAALAVGSGNLFDALGRVGPSGVGPEVAGKLLRYLIRMSARPTPFGLFAGVALAGWGPETDLSIGSRRPNTRTRPDMEWLLRLVLAAEGRSGVRGRLRLFANPRAIVRAGRVFLPEAAPTAGAGAPAPAVSVRSTGAARCALALARAPIPCSDLIAAVAEATGAPEAKAQGLIEELWRQTLLLTDLRPPLTVGSPARYVADRLRDVPEAADLLSLLDAALDAMAAWDALPIERAADTFRSLGAAPKGEDTATPDTGDTAEPDAADKVAADFGDEPPPNASCQVDMALELAGSSVGRTVAEEAARAAELLLRLGPLPAGAPQLDAYRSAFEGRYGPEREVPLLELMDPSFGLGPPSGFHGGAAGGDPRRAASRQRTLQALAVAALRERRTVVNLSETDLARLEMWAPDAATAPQSLDLSVFVVAASATDVDRGRFQIVIGPNLGASGAGRNLGRFADLLGPPAVEALAEAARAEAALEPDRLTAEVAYLPRRFRMGNVAIRPHTRGFEIALGTAAGRPPERVVPLDELTVGLRSGRFYLRWAARGAEVQPFAGHMLTTMQAPDVCRFLDDLRRDGQAQFSAFDWGPASGLPMLPRMQTGRIVLSLAQWRLDGRSQPAAAAGEPLDRFTAELREWRADWRVPRFVYLGFGDNRLLLDLDSTAHARELATELRRLKDDGRLLLQEALPGPDDAWAAGPEGRFITELVVPLVLRTPPVRALAAAPQPRRAAVGSGAERLRPPGSDWLFVKLYGPRELEDDLLTGPVLPLCEQAIADGAADAWFFIRYADPDPHLRLRFRGEPDRLLERLVPQICRWAQGPLSEGMIGRLCFDTYERELERFGGPAGADAAETLFCADSRAVAEMLRLSRSDRLDLDATALAALSIDDMLASLGASAGERLAWYRERSPSRSLAADEFRRRKDALRRLLGDPEHLHERQGGDALARVLAARRAELYAVGERLRDLAADRALSVSAGELRRSYVHLHCNRLLATGRSAEEQLLALLGRTLYSLSQAPLAPGST